jgi:hypothetical protein
MTYKKVDRKVTRVFGTDSYLYPQEMIIFDKVKEKIELKKKIALESGCKLIYTKAAHLQEEIVEDLKVSDPTSKALSWTPIYRQQIISKCCRKIGFHRQGRHNHHPLLIMEVS